MRLKNSHFFLFSQQHEPAEVIRAVHWIYRGYFCDFPTQTWGHLWTGYFSVSAIAKRNTRTCRKSRNSVIRGWCTRWYSILGKNTWNRTKYSTQAQKSQYMQALACSTCMCCDSSNTFTTNLVIMRVLRNSGQYRFLHLESDQLCSILANELNFLSVYTFLYEKMFLTFSSYKTSSIRPSGMGYVWFNISGSAPARLRMYRTPRRL